MFKIVQTLEPGKDRPTLTVIPEKWEQDSILFWPQSLEAIKNNIKNAKSIPSNNWAKSICIVKRSGFLTLAAANAERDEMVLRTESECGNIETQNGRKKRKSSEDNLNDSIGGGELTNDDIEEEKISISPQGDLTPESIICNPISTMQQESIFKIEAEDNISNTEEPFLPQSEVYKIINNQNLIINDLNKIIMEQARQRNILEYICTKLEVNVEEGSAINGEEISRESYEELNPILPLQSVDAVNEMEAKLLNKNYSKCLIEKLSKICGRSGDIKGINCCYTIVDALFARGVMIKYSWCGGSKCEPKLPFKALQNIRKTFLTVVQLADNNFSEVECDKFFKGIVKNAHQRTLNGKIRASRTKSRPKNLQYNKKKTE